MGLPILPTPMKPIFPILFRLNHSAKNQSQKNLQFTIGQFDRPDVALCEPLTDLRILCGQNAIGLL
jgi:hypothetical protein